MAMKPIVLILCDSYLPGSNAGGPIRSIASLVSSLGDHFRFRIITRDRDVGDSDRYASLSQATEWRDVGAAAVLHLRPTELSLRSLRRLLRSTPHDVLYLNSAFSLRMSIVPLLLRRAALIPRRRTIVAPRGEFGPESINVRSTWKKRTYLRLASMLGMFADVTWQASSVVERSQIQDALLTAGMAPSKSIAMHVAGNLSSVAAASSVGAGSKTVGSLRTVFLGRIARIKNIRYAVDRLAELDGAVSLDVYGPIEDSEYWNECVDAARAADVMLRSHGPFEHDRIDQILAQYDLFITPTLNENFGHSILEALAVGCPVIVSDNTPWRDLEAYEAGWVVALADQDRFRRVLQRCVDYTATDIHVYRTGALRYAIKHLANHSARDAHAEMLSPSSTSGA